MLLEIVIFQGLKYHFYALVSLDFLLKDWYYWDLFVIVSSSFSITAFKAVFTLDTSSIMCFGEVFLWSCVAGALNVSRTCLPFLSLDLGKILPWIHWVDFSLARLFIGLPSFPFMWAFCFSSSTAAECHCWSPVLIKSFHWLIPSIFSHF